MATAEDLRRLVAGDLRRHDTPIRSCTKNAGDGLPVMRDPEGQPKHRPRATSSPGYPLARGSRWSARARESGSQAQPVRQPALGLLQIWSKNRS